MANQLPDAGATRTTLRILAAVLLVVGLALSIVGGISFVRSATSESIDAGSGFGAILLLAAGGFCVVFGLGALSAGTLGAQSRYVAGETMPTLKQSAAYLTDGEGLLGVGRTVDDAAPGTGGAAAASGPYCRSCGTRNDQEARFCDRCGASLA